MCECNAILYVASASNKKDFDENIKQSMRDGEIYCNNNNINSKQECSSRKKYIYRLIQNNSVELQSKF